MADWMHGLIDRLRETQHEQIKLLNHIVAQQEKIIGLLELAAKVKPSKPTILNTGINFTRLLQWPIPLYLISALLLLANFTVQEVAEVIRAFAGLQ